MLRTSNIEVTVHGTQAAKALQILRAFGLTCINRNGVLTIHNFASTGTISDLMSSNSITVTRAPRLL